MFFFQYIIAMGILLKKKAELHLYVIVVTVCFAAIELVIVLA